MAIVQVRAGLQVSLAKSAARHPRSSEFFCLIESREQEDEEKRNSAAPNAAVVSLVWGTTVVAMKTFTRSRRVSLADLGVMVDSIEHAPSFEIRAEHGGMTVYTPHGDAVPRDARMRVLCKSDVSDTKASRRATSLVMMCETVRLSDGKLGALVPDARGAALGALAVALFPLLLSILRVGAPDPRAPMDVEAMSDQLRYVQTALAELDRRQEKAPVRDDDHTDTDGVSPSKGEASGGGPGEEGTKGDTSAKSEQGLARAELRRTAPPSVKEIAEEANTFGMVSMLSADDRKARPTSAFAELDIDAANGGLRGDIFKDAFGMGSAGLSGVGEGGGGPGAGVGLRSIDLFGSGEGGADRNGSLGGDGVALAHRHGHLREHERQHQYRTIVFGDGGYKVSGRLPPESIQRVVRASFGRLRACYEEGLLRNPQLEGRVAVKFVIDRDGAVSSASLADGTLEDEKVASCVIAQYTKMSFPQPEGGIVTVVYPVIFSAG